MSEIQVTLPDGSQRSYAKGTTIKEVAQSIGERLGRDAIGGVIDGYHDNDVVDVHTPLNEDSKLEIVTVKTEKGLEVLRHSTSHLMASAVQRLFPGTQVTFGPATDSGFYYDFHREEGFTPDDLEVIEKEMRKIAQQNLPLERIEVTRQEAQKLFEEKGEKFKREWIDSIPEDATITLYQHGDWVDLCEGPHVPTTKYLKAFKLTHVAGAYWRGDENNPMLARIYGTAFWDKKSLDAHMERLEEARKRDHRKVGRHLDLFSFDPVAPAMPFFHPKGARIYTVLENFIRGYYEALRFDEVITPQIVDSELYHRSGHYANYKDNMFFANIDEREFGVKPMNCPGHTLIYAASKRSYRDLPIRYADFGRLHRYERSGVTAGLTRVRSFAQDDAHIFCREDQIADEIGTQMAMIHEVYGHFGFELKIELSTRPEKSIGREEGLEDAERAEWDTIWTNAEQRLRDALDAEDLTYEINEGDGAFYGPKIDMQVQDALGRWYQLGTIQLDFSMPKRFDLKYTNEESGESRPVMIHRAVLGSIERFMGILIEHCAGDFPLWVAPTQVRVLTLNDDLLEHGAEVAEKIEKAGIRVALDRRSEKLGFKIRDSELHKIAVVLVLGNKEKESGQVSVRWRKKGDLGQMSLDDAIKLVLDAAAVPQPSDALRARVKDRFAL